jgi:uncharacterized protein YndB with AHSA1/START domain
MAKIIKHQFFFPHPQETVWEYLTNSELMAQWLMKNNFQPVAGADFQFRIAPIASLDFDGIVYCKVLEMVPFERLSYSWKCGPGDEKISLDSVVIWRLEPTDKGTALFLEHRGFEKAENLSFFNGMNKGWAEKLENIDKLLKAAQQDHTN